MLSMVRRTFACTLDSHRLCAGRLSGMVTTMWLNAAAKPIHRLKRKTWR
jgi:hypothetical protein